MDSALKRGLRAAGIAVALAIAIGHPLLYLWDFAGDAGIHLVYAENASDGAFFEYNLGEPSAGVTSLGYMLLLTLLFVVLPPAAVPIAVKALCILGWYALLYFLFRLASVEFGRGGWAWLTMALAAVFPNAVHKATQGMENGLFAAVTVAWCVLASRSDWFTAARDVPARTELLLGLVGGLALLLRPEAVVFLAVAWICRVGFHAWISKDWPIAIARSAIGAVPVFLVGAAMGLFHRAYTGHLLPTTGSSRIMRTATESFFWGPFQFYPRLIVFLASFALPVTIFWIIGIPGTFSAPPSERRRALAMFAATLTGAYFVFYSCVAPAYHVPRYMISMVPFLALGAVLGARWLLAAGRAATSGPPSRVRAIVVVALVVVLSLWQLRTFVVNTIDRTKEPSFPTLMAFSQAPGRRAETTRALLDDLERSPTRIPVTVAIHEVELRWFLDERFRIYSLDGRTDSLLFDYLDENGTVDHAGWIKERNIAYLLDTRNYNRDRTAWSLSNLRELQPGESATHAGLRFVRQKEPPWLNESSWFRVQPESHPVIAILPIGS